MSKTKQYKLGVVSDSETDSDEGEDEYYRQIKKQKNDRNEKIKNKKQVLIIRD